MSNNVYSLFCHEIIWYIQFKVKYIIHQQRQTFEFRNLQLVLFLQHPTWILPELFYHQNHNLLLWSIHQLDSRKQDEKIIKYKHRHMVSHFEKIFFFWMTDYLSIWYHYKPHSSNMWCKWTKKNCQTVAAQLRYFWVSNYVPYVSQSLFTDMKCEISRTAFRCGWS